MHTEAASCLSSNGVGFHPSTFYKMDIKDFAEHAIRSTLMAQPDAQPIGASIMVETSTGQHVVIAKEVDPYVALQVIRNQCAQFDAGIGQRPLSNAVAICVIAQGWAAPRDNSCETASRHPLRQRVRIALVVSENLVVGTLINFADQPNEFLFDNHQAEGGLAQAALHAMRSVIAYRLDVMNTEMDN